MTDEVQPIYVIESTPSEYAQRRKEHALELGCSEEYAERLRRDVEGRTVQVKSSFESNAIQSQRGVA